MFNPSTSNAHRTKYSPQLTWTFGKNEDLTQNGDFRYTRTKADGTGYHPEYEPSGTPASSIQGLRLVAPQGHGGGNNGTAGSTNAHKECRIAVSAINPLDRYSQRVLCMTTSGEGTLPAVDGISAEWNLGLAGGSTYALRRFIPGETYQVEMEVATDNANSPGVRLDLRNYGMEHPTSTSKEGYYYAYCPDGESAMEHFGYQASAPYYDPSSQSLVYFNGWNPELSGGWTRSGDHQHPDGGGNYPVNALRKFVCTPGPNGEFRKSVVRFKFMADRQAHDWGNGPEVKECDAGEILYFYAYPTGTFDGDTSSFSTTDTMVTTKIRSWKVKRVSDPDCNLLIPDHDYSIKVRARCGDGDEAIGIRVNTRPHGWMAQTEAASGCDNYRSAWSTSYTDTWMRNNNYPYGDVFNFSSNSWQETYTPSVCRAFGNNAYDKTIKMPNEAKHANRERWHRLPVSSFDLEMKDDGQGNMVPTGWYTKTFNFHTRNDMSDYNPNLPRNLFRQGKPLHCDESTYHVSVAMLSETQTGYVTVDSVEVRDETYQKTFKNYKKEDINHLFTFFDGLETGSLSRNATHSSGHHSVSGGSRDVYLENYGNTRYGQYNSSGIANTSGVSYPVYDD